MSRSKSGSATENDKRNVVAAAAAQKFGHRQARGLADDVEQRHLHGRLGLGMADHGVIGVCHQRFDAERVGADQHRPEIDVQRGGIGLDGAGEHGPRCRIAPAGDAGVGFELQNGVLHRACDVARAVAAHQAHRNVGDVDRRRRDLDLLHANPRFPSRFPGLSLSRTMRANHNGESAMRRNPLRERLNAGKPTVGTHILSAWPTLVELIGHSKQYDYVEFTAEYAPFTMHDLDNLGRSFELMNMSRHDQDRADAVHPPGDAGDRRGLPERAVRRHPLGRGRQGSPSTRCAPRRRWCSGARGRGRLGVGMRRDVGTVRKAARRPMSTR